LLDGTFVAGSAITAFQVYDAVRIKRLRAWVVSDAAVGANGFIATVSISLPGGTIGATGVQQETNASSISNQETGFCTIKPDSRSGGALFQSNGAAVAFRIDVTGVARAIVEVDVDYEYNNDNAPTSIAVVPAGATPGQFYFGSMDGLRNAATAWASLLQPTI